MEQPMAGRPKGSRQQGSLASKLINLRVGETMAIPDSFDDACGFPITGPSAGERAVQTMLSRDHDLKQRRYTTKRGVFVAGTTYVQQMLLIERHMDKEEE